MGLGLDNHTMVLGFDPYASENKELHKIFDDNLTRTFWLLWKRNHIVNQYFNGECIEFAKRFRKERPVNKDQFVRFFRKHYGFSFMGMTDIGVNIFYEHTIGKEVKIIHYNQKPKVENSRKEYKYLCDLWPYFRDDCSLLNYTVEVKKESA